MCEIEIITIAVIGGKGGIGKSSSALNIARHFGCRIITNDKMSKLPILCQENEVTIIEDIEFIETDDCVVYDFGGYVDSNMIDIVKKVDVVVYVTTSEPLAYGQVTEYMADLLPYNDNAFVLANQLGMMPNDGENKTKCMEREFNLLKREVGEQFDIEVYPLKYSKKIKKGFWQGLSLDEVLSEYASKGAWKTELEQFENITKRIKG